MRKTKRHAWNRQAAALRAMRPPGPKPEDPVESQHREDADATLREMQKLGG